MKVLWALLLALVTTVSAAQDFALEGPSKVKPLQNAWFEVKGPTLEEMRATKVWVNIFPEVDEESVQQTRLLASLDGKVYLDFECDVSGKYQITMYGKGIGGSETVVEVGQPDPPPPPPFVNPYPKPEGEFLAWVKPLSQKNWLSKPDALALGGLYHELAGLVREGKLDNPAALRAALVEKGKALGLKPGGESKYPGLAEEVERVLVGSGISKEVAVPLPAWAPTMLEALAWAAVEARS